MELLVVERNFAVPVRADGPHLVPVGPDEVEAPDVVDDAVDDLIEAVALRRGEVVIVPDGVLEDMGRVAAALRFERGRRRRPGMRCPFPAGGDTLCRMSYPTALLLLT